MFQAFTASPGMIQRSGIFQTLFLIVVVIVAIWLLYSFLRKRRETNGGLNRFIVLGKPRNGKQAAQFCDGRCPSIDAAYTMSVWLYLDDWDYKYGQWKHVVHRGTPNGQRVQPVVLLHPTQNKLVVVVETVQDQNMSIYDVKTNFIYPNNTIYRSFENTTLDALKDFCNNDSTCSGFTAIVNKEGAVHTAYACNVANAVPIYDKTIESVDFKRLLSSGNYQLKTFTKLKRQSINPILNQVSAEFDSNTTSATKTEHYEIPNIPINQWFNFTMVVSGNTAEFYLDGLLVRSATLNNFFRAPAGDIYVSLPNPPLPNTTEVSAPGFSGRMAKLMYIDERLSFTAINKLFREGPSVPANMNFGGTEKPIDTADLSKLYTSQSLDDLFLKAAVRIGPDGYPITDGDESCN